MAGLRRICHGGFSATWLNSAKSCLEGRPAGSEEPAYNNNGGPVNPEKLASDPAGIGRQALVVLVGITANRRKRSHLRRYFGAHGDYDVFVPDLPYRRPLKEVAAWYAGYLANEVRPERYDKLHCIAYIAAGALLRCLPAGDKPAFERMVCFRGPYQERVAARLVARIGRWLAGLVAGRTALDLADGWPAALPWQRHAAHEALIVEEGRTRMARWLGIRAADIPPQSWSDAELLPGAEAALHVPQSHDDVYTADAVLAAALGFIRHGRFPDAGHDACRP